MVATLAMMMVMLIVMLSLILLVGDYDDALL